MILFRVSQREFRKGSSRGIEPGDLISVLLAEPNQFALRVALNGIHAGVFGWRIEDRHLGGLVIHLH